MEPDCEYARWYSTYKQICIHLPGLPVWKGNAFTIIHVTFIRTYFIKVSRDTKTYSTKHVKVNWKEICRKKYYSKYTFSTKTRSFWRIFYFLIIVIIFIPNDDSLPFDQMMIFQYPGDHRGRFEIPSIPRFMIQNR